MNVCRGTACSTVVNCVSSVRSFVRIQLILKSRKMTLYVLLTILRRPERCITYDRLNPVHSVVIYSFNFQQCHMDMHYCFTPVKNNNRLVFAKETDVHVHLHTQQESVIQSYSKSLY